MLYKFKSKAAGDLIMLEPHGRRLMEIIGKAPGPTGIIQPAEMPAALVALDAAIAQDEARRQAAAQQARAQGVEPPREEVVSLRQRAAPLMDMLRRCEKAGKDIVWGV